MPRDRFLRAGDRTPGSSGTGRSAAACEVAAAAAELITGPLLVDPHGLGKPLGEELAGIYSARLGRSWRVLYESDEQKHAVIVLDIRHRSAAYRSR